MQIWVALELTASGYGPPLETRQMIYEWSATGGERVVSMDENRRSIRDLRRGL